MNSEIERTSAIITRMLSTQQLAGLTYDMTGFGRDGMS